METFYDTHLKLNTVFSKHNPFYVLSLRKDVSCILLSAATYDLCLLTRGENGVELPGKRLSSLQAEEAWECTWPRAEGTSLGFLF